MSSEALQALLLGLTGILFGLPAAVGVWSFPVAYDSMEITWSRTTTVDITRLLMATGTLAFLALLVDALATALGAFWPVVPSQVAGSGRALVLFGAILMTAYVVLAVFRAWHRELQLDLLRAPYDDR